MSSTREGRVSMSQFVSKELFACAVDLSDEGAHEFAFPSIIARDVFDELVLAGCSILGGDLWKRIDGGFVFGQESWHSGKVRSVEREWEVFFDLFQGQNSYFSFAFRV
ncbi:hypothetical protein [Nocardiopsis deserti]|uniref:hypothetical protein n=1 Tax=Nocardiopsis deserti TaxID=2605988 RepID=UPI00123B8AA8|nr:hypothetical protein [Nocardiopsis deserti]